MTETRNVAIYIFDEVEVLDFCGPFEVFSVTGRRDHEQPFNVFTVASQARPILARNELSINPRYTFADCPKPDLLLIPGGFGTRQEMHKQPVLDWIKNQSETSELVLSVCTGSLILGRAGLLDGLTATSHHLALEEFKAAAPNTTIDAGKRFIDNGKVVTAAGISAGIDMSLYIVARLLGMKQAVETATYMEYDWKAAHEFTV
jgi:transcriptional regulator GlxA family with amidase domain